MTVRVGIRDSADTGFLFRTGPVSARTRPVPNARHPLLLLCSHTGHIVESVHSQFAIAGEEPIRSTVRDGDGTTVEHDPSSALPDEKSLEAVRQVDAR